MLPAHRVIETVSNGNAVIETLVDGKGPSVVMLPSFGRDVGADFDEFAEMIAKAGFQVLRPRPRGIGHSSGSMHASLQDTAWNLYSTLIARGKEVNFEKTPLSTLISTLEGPHASPPGFSPDLLIHPYSKQAFTNSYKAEHILTPTRAEIKHT